MGTVARKSIQKTILIADDDPDDVEIVTAVLREGNISNSIQIVSDGVEAIAYLAGTGHFARREKYPYPALMLLDLKMPKKSGLEVLEFLRAESKAKPLGIIILTGLQNLREVQQAYQLGAHSFLLKPLALESLLNLINALKGFTVRKLDGAYELDFAKPN